MPPTSRETSESRLIGWQRLELCDLYVYVVRMAQVKTIPSSFTVRNSRTGQVMVVKGAGVLKGSELSIKRGVDLTKPIAEQVLTDIPSSKTK